LTLACLTSAATLPTVYGPKQDFGGALTFIELRRGPEDAVLAIDMAAMPYRDHYGVGWPEVDNLADLTAIERMHPRTWVVYTTPTRFRAEHLDIWRRLEAEYEEARTFPGTVNGGEVVVMVRARPAE
jgi:hypothetical protein